MKSKNVDVLGNGLSPAQKAGELNILSYLVRKHPKEAMKHLSSVAMRDEINARCRATGLGVLALPPCE